MVYNQAGSTGQDSMTAKSADGCRLIRYVMNRLNLIHMFTVAIILLIASILME
jgi:hypothetical protein